MFDFPSPATNGQLVTGANGQVYRFDSVKWAATGGSGGVTSFNTRTGAVTLSNTDVTTVLPASNTTPVMDGAAAVGVGTTWARADHVHPTDTSRAATSAIPAASSTTPVMDGAAAVGVGTTWARADHVHPVDTSRYAASNPSGYQTAAQVTTSLGAYLPLTGGTMTGQLAVQAGGVQIQPGGSNPTLYMYDGIGNRSVFYFEVATGRTQMTDIYSGSALYLDPGGSFTYAGGSGIAYKTGGGSWTAPSDARIKTVLGEYASGLTEILALRPVRYAYRGNDALTPDEVSPNAKAATAQTEFIGLIAQEAEGVMPELVKQHPGFVDGAAVPDLRTLDPSALVFALINAVKTLADRVAALEGVGE